MVLAVAPLLLYGVMILVPLILAVAVRFVIVVPMRECIQCERKVAVTTLTCRHCGHRYTSEDRELMKLRAKRLASEAEWQEPPVAMPGVPSRPRVAAPRSGVPRMTCIECGGKVALTALTCRHCGHRYTASERERMRSAGESTPV